MYSDDVVYKTPENFDIISYMDIVADDQSGICRHSARRYGISSCIPRLY